MSTQEQQTKLDGGASVSNATLLCGWLRRVVLWVTGRDLLEPPLPELPQGVNCKISGMPKPRWEMTLSADAYLKFYLPTGPNVLHRLAQRLALGIRWRMLPKTTNYGGKPQPAAQDEL